MHVYDYHKIRKKVENTEHGYRIEQLQDIKECENAYEFFRQHCWVVISSNLSNQAAQNIFKKVLHAIEKNKSIKSVFNHDKKTNAIEYVYNHKYEIFEKYKTSNEKVEFLTTLPYIGKTTKYHLARNLGLDVCKPDRHLERSCL